MYYSLLLIFQKSLNIPDAAPMMPMGFMPMAAAPATEVKNFKSEILISKGKLIQLSNTMVYILFDYRVKNRSLRKLKVLLQSNYQNLMKAKKWHS